MKLFSTTRKEKGFLAIGFLIAAVIVGYGAWSDMHRKDDAQARPGSYNRIYYVGNEGDLEHLPDDSYPVAALAGSFTAKGGTKGGADSFAPSDIKPVNFPQREADLFYRLDGIPVQLGPFYDALDKSIDKWHSANNFFNTVYLQDTDPKDSLEDLSNLCAAVKNHLQHDYSINVFIDRDALAAQKDPKVFLGNMTKNVWTIIFDAETAQKPGETLAQTILALNAYESPFLVAVHEKPDVAKVLQAIHGKTKYFMGFLLMEPETAKAHEEKKP
ncbi:MAG: hypothetical protein GC185_13725 [Alphaproteobacteria bacterium]|nr:hypothetical protein [Alphaproteobacteria bacterium]